MSGTLHGTPRSALKSSAFLPLSASRSASIARLTAAASERAGPSPFEQPTVTASKTPSAAHEEQRNVPLLGRFGRRTHLDALADVRADQREEHAERREQHVHE